MKFTFSKTTLGFIVILGWCLVSAYARLYTSDIEQHLDPYLICLFIFGFSALFFLLLTVNRIPRLIRKSKTSWSNILGLNVSTFASWFFILYPLKYIEPSLVSTMSLGLTPVATLALGLLIYRQGKIKKQDVGMSILFFTVIVVICALIFLGKTGAAPVLFSHEVLSVLFCFIVGLGAAATSIYGKRLTNEGFDPMDILLIRFLILIVVSAIVFAFSSHPVALSPELILHLLIIAVILVIVPMYLLFVGIRLLEPITLAILFPLMPAMTFFLEFSDARLHPNVLVVSCVLAIALLSFIGGFLRYRKEQSA